MNIKDYGKICSKKTTEILQKTINSIRLDEYPSRRTYWLPIDRDPKNNIENFVIKTFNLYFSEIDKKSVVGFEWWFQTEDYINQDSRNGQLSPILHFDCDENKNTFENIIISPLGCTITYLTNTKNSPTFITNVKTIGYKSHYPDLPTEIIYSYPGEGKFLIFDPKYLHGIDRTKQIRTTLLYNVWDYEVSGTEENFFNEDLTNLEIIKNKEKNIKKYNGPFEYANINVLGIPMTVKKPSKYKFYDSYHVNV
jgi:hypothetical protein